MEYYITKPADYWIANNAVSITLNALGDKNRIQGSVASGAVIMCFVEDIKAESAGGESGNGDGLWYGANHEPKRWPLSLSPTYFNSDTRKYVYAAIPRSTAVGTQAVIVFPSEKLDIYGRAERISAAGDGSDVTTYEQIGSSDYFYVYLQGIIGAPSGSPEQRNWEQEITDWGRLDTAQGRDDKINDGEWYSYSAITQAVTFLKKIIMGTDSWFQNLIVGNGSEKGILTGVATSDNATDVPGDSKTHIVTPSYIDEFGNNRYLSKIEDDEAAGEIGFLRGLWIKAKGLFGIDAEGNALLNNVDAAGSLKVTQTASIGGDANVGGDLTVDADANITGQTYANGGVRTDEVRSSNYTGDTIADTGFLLTAGLTNGLGHSKLTVDEIYVRMKATFESLEVKKWSVTAGDEIHSCAANVINRVDYFTNAGDLIGYTEVRVPFLARRVPFLLKLFGNNSNRWGRYLYSKTVRMRTTIGNDDLQRVRYCRCYFLADDGDTHIENWWDKDDLARCQTMNVVNTTRKTYTSVQQKAGNVFWWRKVIRVSANGTAAVENPDNVNCQPALIDEKTYHWFDVAYDLSAEQQGTSHDCVAGSDLPAAGDHVVQFGNTTKPGRMNLWITMVNGGGTHDYDPDGDAPCIKGFVGIYTFDLNRCFQGGHPCKMTLAPGKKYHFYGREFRVIKEYGTVPMPTQRGEWTAIAHELDEYDDRPTYTDDIITAGSHTRSDGKPLSYARKCYWYDEVTHLGCTWLCSITDGSHWVTTDVIVHNGTRYEMGTVIEPGIYSALSTENKLKCVSHENYTTDEPSSTSASWTKLVDRGTSITSVETRYRKKSRLKYNSTLQKYEVDPDAGIIPPAYPWEQWYTQEQWQAEQQNPASEQKMQNGDFLWSRTKTEYSDTLSATFEDKVSMWGIDGDGIGNINTYYLGLADISTVVDINHDAYKMPDDPNWASTAAQGKWFDNFDDMASANGGISSMQAWNVWTKTVIHYDIDPNRSVDEQKPDIITYSCNRIGMDGQIGQEEYYMLAASPDFATAFPNSTGKNYPDYDSIGIRWYNQASPASASYRLAEATQQQPNINTQMWSTSMPAYDKTRDGNKKYLWNFEYRVDGQGTPYATKPICVGNHARGIVGLVEVYALSVSGQAQSGHHIPDDIWAANNNSETDTSQSDPLKPKTWSDEIYDRAPSEALPYQWNWTRTLYSDKENGIDYEDHYHVSAVRGSRGADGAGIEYVYCRPQSHNANGTALAVTLPDPNILKDAGGTVRTADYIKKTDDFVPYEYTDSPVGIDFTHQIEYQCERKSSATAGAGGFTGGHEWGQFSQPKVWSKWGKNGQDGDGVEYVFIRTSQKTEPELSSSTGQDSYGRNVTDAEYLPMISNAVTCGAETNHNRAGECTDDPKGCTRQYPYEWVAKRTMTAPNAETGHRQWKSYYASVGSPYKMSLWSNYAENTMRLDLDNEMDMVQTDSTGKVEKARTVSTTARVYDGARVATTNVTMNDDASTLPIGTKKNGTANTPAIMNNGDGSYTITWSFAVGDTIQAATAVGIDFLYLNVPYTAQFTLVASMGQPVYQLAPTLNSINFSRKADNSLDPDRRTLGLKILKLDGDSTAELTALPTGYTVRWKYDVMPSSSTDSTATTWTTGNVDTIPNDTTHSDICIVLFMGTVAVDRETIPILKDGAHGDGSVRLDLDNQADIVSLDSEGKIRFDRTIVTHARIYDGGTPVTSGVTNTTTDSLVIGGCTPTVSLSGGVLTVTWAFAKGMTGPSAAQRVKTIKMTYDGVEYFGVFSLGTTDAEAIYQVLPSPSEVSFSVVPNTNALTPPSITLKCGYTKYTGSGTTTTANPDSYTIASGHYLYYRAGVNGVWGSWTVYTGALTVANSTTNTDYEFAISTQPSTATQAQIEAGIYERECVPVIKDGLNGDGINSITRTYNISKHDTSTNDTTPPTDCKHGTWQANSPAVEEEYPCLWCKEVVDFKYGADTTHYYFMGKKGDNGIDAKDVEFVYARTKENVAPQVPESGTYSEASNNYNQDDHRPYVFVASSKDISGSTDPVTSGGNKYVKCTDDPQGVNDTWKFEWELKRTKGTVQSDGSRDWNPYSGTMTLHNNLAESAYIIDLDNEADQFGTDSESKVITAQTRSTGVTLYYGTQEQTITKLTAKVYRASAPSTVIGTATATTSGTEVSGNVTVSSAKIATVRSKFTGTAGIVAIDILANVTIDDDLFITITAESGRGGKSADFALQKVKSGAPGEDPVIYQLELSQKCFSYGRSASNNLVAKSNSVTVNLKVTKGNTSNIYTSAASIPSGLTVPTYSWGYDSGTSQESSKAIGTTITVAPASVGSHTKVWFLLTTGDREEVPIVTDGENGGNGDTPIACYRWYQTGITPSAPTGASDEPTPAEHTSDTTKAQPSGKWSKTAPNRPEGDGWMLWMSQNTKHKSLSNTYTYDSWSTPVRISGDTGSPGEDAGDREWIYRRYTEAQTWTSANRPGNAKNNTTNKTYADDDYYPEGWDDNPQGVTDYYLFEYAWWRDKARGTDVAWDSTQGTSGWNGPVLWSHYGERGMDGDGVEYVFVRTKNEVIPSFYGYAQSGNKDSYGRTIDQDEQLPLVSIATGSTGDIKGNTNYNPSGYNGKIAECTDDPEGVDSTYRYEWVLKRTKGTPVGGVRTWEAYSGAMALWAKWSEDGESAWLADLDNEMDSISCDDSGYVLLSGGSAQSVSTTVNLYYGSQKEFCKITGVKRGTTAMTNGTESNGVTASWLTTSAEGRTLTITYATTAKITGKDDFEITVKDSGEEVERKLHFTVNGVIGDVYNLRPAKSEIVATRNANNTFNVTGIICGYTRKNIDGTLTEVDDVTDTHSASGPYPLYIDDKYNIWYHRRLRSTGDWETDTSGSDTNYAWYAYNEANYRAAIVSNFNPNTYDAVEFLLCTEIGNFRRVPTLNGIIDREIVHVVADGATGESAWLADLDNEMDSVSIDEKNHPVVSTMVSTVLNMFYGATPKTFSTPTVRRISGNTTTNMTVNLNTASSNVYTDGVAVIWTPSQNKLSVYYDITKTKATQQGSYTYTETAATINDKDDYEITLSASDNGTTITRILHFTVKGVAGDVYNLLPRDNEIVASVNANGRYVVGDSETYYPVCGYTRTVNGVITERVDSVTDGQINFEHAIFYRLRNRSTGQWTMKSGSDTIKGYSRFQSGTTSFNVNTYDGIEYNIFPFNDWRQGYESANPDCIDVEKVYVIANGKEGHTPDIRIGNNKNWYIDGVDTGIKAEGTDGTGVEIKGTVATRAKLTISGNKGYAIPMKSDGTDDTQVEARHGDCYICNSDRHLYMFTSTPSVAWNDLGEFKGEPGLSSYMHIAYATGNPLNPTTTNVNTIGFTVDNAGTSYDWWGFCTDNDESDPGRNWSSLTNAQKVAVVNTYKWNYMKGRDGSGVEYIYLLTKKGFTPTISESSGASGHDDPTNNEFYPLVGNYSGNQSKIYPGTATGAVYWDDDPAATVSDLWPMLWWAKREYKDGTGWGSFGAVLLHNNFAPQGDFKSRVFARTNSSIGSSTYRPTGGSYNAPWPGGSEGASGQPGGVRWYDGIPSGTAEQIWSSVRTFKGDGTETTWSIPAPESDTGDIDVEFSMSTSTTAPTKPSGSTPYADHRSEGWYDPKLHASTSGVNWSEMVWRAERKVRNGAYDGDWTISRIRGEKGDGQVDYLIRSSIERITVPPDAIGTGAQSTTFTFWRNNAGTLVQTAFYYRLYTRKGSSYTATSYYNTAKLSSATINLQVTDYTTIDAYVMVIGDSQFPATNALPATYLAKLEVPVDKQGDTGPTGDDAVVYSLKPSPESMNFRSDAVGDFNIDDFSVECNVIKTEGEVTTILTQHDTLSGLWLAWRWEEGTTWYHGSTIGSTNTGYTYTPLIDESTILDDNEPGVVFALSKNSGMTQIICEVTVPFICDGRKGNTGAAGKMFYSEGEWTAKTYTRSDLMVPMVHYDDGDFSAATGRGNYYYLNADTASSSDVPGTSSKWVKADGFGVVITQGLFAEFAKMGNAIMSGDYMFSMNGRIGTTTYTAGARVSGETVPAYTHFVGDPEVAKSTQTYERGTSSSMVSTSSLQIASLMIQKNAPLTIAYSGKASASNAAQLQINRINGSQKTTEKSWTLGTSLNGTSFTFNPTVGGQYEIYLQTFTSVSVYLHTEWYLTNVFEPFWWVDLQTGKMSAARGNFVAYANGDVEMSGTIKARNFFHQVCIVDGTNYSNGMYYNVPSGTYNASGSGILCTYDSDVIQYFASGDNTLLTEPDIYLPAPEDFKGKMVTITATTYAQNDLNFVVSCVKKSGTNQYRMIFGAGYNGSSVSIKGNPASAHVLTTGYDTSYLSIEAEGVWRWMKIRI